MPTLQPDEDFLRYEEEIVSNPTYAGMPDLRYPDGRIQWEAPSNRQGGEFRDSHDKRYAWWRRKAEEVGISTSDDHWISKVAKLIHPTKRRPCKVCGRVMDIRYCYLNSGFMHAVKKYLPYATELSMDECTNILDFVVDVEELYGQQGIDDLRKALRCKAVDNIPQFQNLDELLTWLKDTYIPAEPSRLSPGAMSNAPDRLDGFHTYNRCCRHKADKGRSRENLASYSTDRRAFEYWVDGNWVTANKTMGLFRTDPKIKSMDCMNVGNGGTHPKPCAADHIGPISLGFIHRPTFQPLCNPCNSAKNNRMYLSDVQKLIGAENAGVKIVTWYAKPIWDKLKTKVVSQDDAVKLTRVMRDNRHNAMTLLGLLQRRGRYIFLSSFLNLDYADFSYDLVEWNLDSKMTLSATYSEKPSDLEYSRIQKARRTRVAFQALKDYLDKENRNGYEVNFDEKNSYLERIDTEAKAYEEEFPSLHIRVEGAINKDEIIDEELKEIVCELPTTENALKNIHMKKARKLMNGYMEHIADELADMWNDPRYERLSYADDSNVQYRLAHL